MASFTDVHIVESTPRFANVIETKDGARWEGQEDRSFISEPVHFQATPAMFIIHEAWDRGLDLEAEADGYGAGFGTNGDWSGIRDSSQEAKNKMLTKALNFLFGEK